MSTDKYTSMPQVDEVIADRYRIENKLGEGGMGVVYTVRHIGIDRLFAMKVLSPRLSMDTDYQTRFMREAKITARLNHPHVVQVFDSGVYKGLLYIVMEYLDGTPLSELLWTNRIGGIHEILQIGWEISDALGAAHDIGLIHRDLKTDNVLVEENPVTSQRRCVLLDFGLAFIEESDDLGRLTRDSDTNVAGTPLYMSPEQISSAALTSATDIYSLGCLLYELVSGETPFEGGDAVTVIKVMTRHLFKSPEPLRHKAPDVPLPLEELIMSMLAKDPSLRPDAHTISRNLRDIKHLPETGRGGSLLSREERQVQAPTKRDDNLQDTAKFDRSKKKQLQVCRIGLWGLELGEDHELALASSGFVLSTIFDLTQLQDIDLLILGDATLPDIEYLAQRTGVILYVDAGDIANAMPLLRAGVLDIMPHDAGINEIVKRLERVRRRRQRELKRNKD